MNRYCYKTIYSKTLQRIIVVAEHARGEGKAGRSNITTYPIADSFCALRQLSWRIALATGSLLILPLAQAQIVADPQAPREHQPQVLLSTEQLPQVDIQTPSAAGVSVNEYRQFDVGQEGALLNNSRKGAPTHTGGWVSGNPNLIKGEAQVIVNQVNSSAPSQLHGHIEVAGQKADVILANPAGISVNGSGFINAGKTWLTTGSPQLENGTFNGVNVERGTVHIGERGLDVRNSDYAAIIAKASKIDGPVQAGDRPLDVITGSNHVASDGKISGKGGSSTGSANTAIDTGQLGGMYGGSIRLISTDQGVGVNHAGAVQAQQLQISADGKLINRGSIDSDQLELDAHSLDNHGRISQGSGTLQVSAKTLDNAGSIRRNHVPENPKAQTGNDTAGTKTTAKSRGKDGHIHLKEGLDNRGQISSGSELHLQIDKNLNNPGQLDVGALQVKDGETHNSGRIQAETASIRGNKLDNSGHFSASKHIDAATHEMDNSGVLMAPSLYLRGDSLNNSGQIIGTGSGSMQIWTADWNNYGHVGNSAGGSAPDNSDTDGAQNKTATRKQTGGSSAATTSSSDNSAGSSSLTFSHITNSGSISQSGGVDLNVAGTFTNRGDMTLKSLNYQGETLDNREGKIRSQTAAVQATTLDNESGLFAAEHITRLDIQKLNNKNGVFYSGDDLRFSVAHFENPAGSTIGSGKTLSVKSPIIDNDGRLFANNVLELEAQRLNNRGNLQGGALAIDTVELNNPGTIEQTGRGILTVKAKNLHNQKDGI
ncbi:MAG: filamentous hemagglutinin N-terminal domain-containing protein, partial [Cardiobacterium sp.]